VSTEASLSPPPLTSIKMGLDGGQQRGVQTCQQATAFQNKA